jgi:hypothetical protein
MIPLGGTPGKPKWELLVHTPAVFVRVASKGLTGYGTWKCIRKMEDSCRAVGRLERLNVKTLRRDNDGKKPEKESGRPGWSVKFKGHGSTIVNSCQG